MKTKAQYRLQASVSESEPPRFRYVDDVQRHLDTIRGSVTDLGKVGAQTRVRASVKKVGAQWGLIADLYDLNRQVSQTEAQFSLQFDERGGHAYSKVEASVASLRHDIASQMRSAFYDLEAQARESVPTKFKAYVSAVATALNSQVPGARVCAQFLYPSTNAVGQQVFTSYSYLVGASAEDHVYVSVQAVVGGKTYVQANHEFATPDELMTAGPGELAPSSVAAVKAVLALLAAEGVKTEAAKLAVVSSETDVRASSSLASALTFL